MKTLNLIRKILLFPMKLIVYPFLIIAAFFATDFEDDWEVNYLKKTIKTYLWE